MIKKTILIALAAAAAAQDHCPSPGMAVVSVLLRGLSPLLRRAIKSNTILVLPLE